MYPTTTQAASFEQPFVVFLIGARVNKWWQVHRWLPVARAMPRMIAELQSNPAWGLLGAESFVGRTSCMVQYWRSMDHLMAYARAKDSQHLPAWRHFNQVVRKSGAVGVWHETYCVQPGAYENAYVAMPPFGFGRIGQLRAKGG